MTDLTRLHAHEMAALLRSGEVSARELRRGAPGRGRARQPRPQRLADDRPGARARRGRCGGREARRRALRRFGARPAPAAAGHPDRPEGPRLGEGRPVHRRVAHPRGLSSALRRPHHRAPARGRRGDPGQDQHGRVRDGLLDRALGLRADGQSLGAGPGARREQRRIGRRRRRLPRPALDRHRHRRVDPPAGGAVRDRRAEADLRAGQPLRDRRLRQLARPDRAVRPGRAGRGRPAARGGRPRRPRLDLVAGAGAGEPDRAAGR